MPEPRASSFVCVLRRAVALGVITWTLLGVSSARADVEKRVGSSTTTLELGADGAAIVRHELALEVRGGPLASFSLRGVDADAEPLPDATLIRTSDGEAASAPQPVIVQAEDGRLDVSLPAGKSLRGNRFLLRLGYRTRLGAAQIRQLPDPERAELGWVGPRFDDGVDAVTLILRSRAGRTPPEVVSEDEREPQYGQVLSTLRRSRERDELELVRPHVARDEPIRWLVRLDRALLGAADPMTSSDLPRELASDAAAREPAFATPAARGANLFELACLGALGVAQALLVWLKAGAVAAAAAARRSRPRPGWLGAQRTWRALASGAALGGAGAAALFDQPAWLGALALLLAMACAVHQAPAAAPSRLGPGEWRPQGPEVLVRVPAPPLPGAWLDAGRVRGFVLLVAALGGIVALAARAFQSSPYTGACILLGGAALLPTFCTGRAAELPLDELGHARHFLGEVARRLAASTAFSTIPIGRVAAASGELDELRLSLSPPRAVPGLIGLELGLELRERLGGFAAEPVVVVRAVEGSECQRALPRGLPWMRGRSAEERACLVRPKLPTVALSVALLAELGELWLAPPQGARDREPSAKKASKSGGKELATAKAGTRASPAHAT